MKPLKKRHSVGDEFLSYEEAGEILGRSRPWIYVALRRIPDFPQTVTLPGGRPRLVRQEIEAFRERYFVNRGRP